MKRLKDHVILCCFSDGLKSPMLGLCSYIMPLRASNLRLSQLHTVVVLADEEFLRKEWPTICNFPDVYVKTVCIVHADSLYRENYYDKLHILSYN